jgi:hypothetical protein
MPLEKRTVKCPDCKKEDVEIFTGDDSKGICKCGCDVEAVYRHAHYMKLAKTVSEPEEPKPEPKPAPKKRGGPFSFNMP